MNRLVTLLEEHGIWYCVCGGFAIDGHMGRLTRDHHDIDIVLKYCDIDRLDSLPLRLIKPRIETRSVMRAKFFRSDVSIEILLLEKDDQYYWIKGRKEYSLVPASLMEGAEVTLCGVKYKVPAKELLLATKLYTDRPIDIQDRAALTNIGANMDVAQKYPFCYVVHS